MSIALGSHDAHHRGTLAMRGVVKLAATCLLGALIGLVTAYLAVTGRIDLASQSKGQWIVWPSAGTPQVDPYTRAHFLFRGRLPISHFEAIEFEARTDDDGRALDGSCVYSVSGTQPRVRWWGLSALPIETGEVAEDARGGTLLSRRAVYEPDGSFRATVSPQARPGNWLKPAAAGPMALVFRVYNPEPQLRQSPLSVELPSVRRGDCL